MNGSRYGYTRDPMSGSLKLGLTIILAVVAIGLAIQLLGFVWHLIWHILVPIAVIIAIGYVVFNIFGRKSIGGGRRYLP